MPRLTVEGMAPVEVPPGTRLVRAIEGAGVDIGHRCGGFARCTTCRVAFLEGEPERMTAAERDKLRAAELSGVRLSCQILVDRDMTVRPLMRVGDHGWPGPGPEPAEEITPPAEWVSG